MASSYQDRIKARRGTGVNKKKDKKVKTNSKDPRPKQSDIGKKYKNYGEFRQAVKAWRVRNGFAKAPKPKEKKEYVSPRERKFGKDKLKINKEIDKNVDTYVKKMKSFNPNPVRKVDYPSKTEKPKNKEVKKDNNQNKENNQNKGPNLEAANEILSGKKKEVTMADFKGDGEKSEGKAEGKKKKESKWIRNPKTKNLVRKTSQKGKQLLKIKSRIDARNKKLFGDKKKKKKKK